MEPLLELAVLPHAVAVPPDVDDVTVMHETVDQGARHDIIPKDLAPVLEARVAREDGGGALVAAAHELQEEHGAGPRAREVAELVHDEERGKDEGLEPLAEPAGRLRLLQ